MQKKLKKPGKNISSIVEVQNISTHGLWIIIGEKEFFLPFSEFPWFLKGTVEQIYQVEQPHEGHLYWPSLDIDISIDSLEHPEKYPLTYLS